MPTKQSQKRFEVRGNAMEEIRGRESGVCEEIGVKLSEEIIDDVEVEEDSSYGIINVRTLAPIGTETSSDNGLTGPCRYQCDACPYTTNHKYSFTIHQRIHTVKKPYKCEQCGKAFCQKPNLNSHLLSHQGRMETSWCEYCRKGFRSRKNLSAHRLECASAPCRFQCDICSYITNDESNFLRHLKFHAGEKRYTCDECGKEFRHKERLSKHLISHGNHSAKHQCGGCGRGFHSNYHLNRHQRICKKIQSNAGPTVAASFKCDQRTHTKPYACDECDRLFSHAANLESHRICHHNHTSNYQCEHCGKYLSSSYHHSRHELACNKME